MSRKNQSSQSKRSQKNMRRCEKKKRTTNRRQSRANKEDFKQALHWFFGTSNIFSDIRFHGNIKWLAMDLVQIALLLCWSEKPNITDAFYESLKRCKKLGVKTVHQTYQGYIGALSGYTHLLLPPLILLLQQKMAGCGVKFWEISGFVPIAFDGSRLSAARTPSNERELCSKKSQAKKKKAKTATSITDPKPQAWITLMWHMGLRLPWDWRLGPSDSSERHHVRELLTAGQFPENTLFCGDAGFVGYDFWKAILSQGYDLMVRVGGNVKLIEETMDYRRTGDGQVLCWPKDKQGKQPPLRLRLVEVTIGKTKVYLLTSVLDATQLDRQAMCALYKKRWGIEIEFRGLKQTLASSKMRCRNVDRFYAELHWSIFSMAVAELFALKEQLSTDHGDDDYSPKDRSLAETMKAIYDCLDELDDVPSSRMCFFSRLALAMTDNYQRKKHSKKARFRPPSSEKNKKKIGHPQIRKIEPSERKKIEKLAA